MTTAIIKAGDVTLYVPFVGTIEMYDTRGQVVVHANTAAGLSSAYLPKGKMEVQTA